MFTNSGLCRKKPEHRQPFQWTRLLMRCPQKRGKVMKVRITSPRKPNSARRKTAKINLTNAKTPVAYIPGGGHTLKRFSTVLLRGKGGRDLPGVYSSCMRGKFDLHPVIGRRSRRSIYGIRIIDVE